MTNIIRIDETALFNNAPAATLAKVYKRHSMFDGLGHPLDHCETYDQVMEESGMDYTGQKASIYLGDGTLIKDNFAVVKNDEPSRVLGIVGNQYQAVGNRDAFAVAEEIVNEGRARYELGGPCLGAKNSIDYSRAFLTLRGDDFNIGEDVYNSFIVFNNSFDGSTGIRYQVLCQRLVCLNGMVRYLGGKKNQLQINIQHSKSAPDRIKQAHEIIMKRQEDIELIKREAQLFIGTTMTREEFEKEIIPLILTKMKLVEKDKERERGKERIDRVVSELLQCYNADDTQNYNNSAWKILLALSDFETHSSPLRDTGNKAIYLNRVAKGMLLTSAAAEYIADKRSLAL